MNHQDPAGYVRTLQDPVELLGSVRNLQYLSGPFRINQNPSQTDDWIEQDQIIENMFIRSGEKMWNVKLRQIQMCPLNSRYSEA